MWRRAADAPPLAVRKGCTTLKWNRWRDVGRAGSLRGSWPIDNRPQLTKLPHRSAANLAYHLRSDASPLADESRRRPLLCRLPGIIRLRYHSFLTSKLILPFGLALFLAQAQTTGQFALTIDNIMRGPALVGYEPAQPRWSYDSEHIYFQWKQSTDREDAPMDTYAANRDGSRSEEHTSELQSLRHLVCRLLLEK